MPLQIGDSHILMSSGSSVTENAGEVLKNIKEFFNDMGGSCVELLTSSLKLYKKMLLSAVEILSVDYAGTVGTNSYTGATEHYGTFSDFWTVIDNVTGVLGAIATTLITLLFLISFVNESWDTRHEMDFSSFFKSFARFFAAVVLVNNASLIVTTLFTLSSKVAALISGTNNLTSINVGVDIEDANLIKYGVSGPKGLIISILFLLVFLVIFASGMTIMIEVYQRIFKIFILIPFSCISFSTFAMSDSHRGSEVFHGYLKSIISTAIESVVILVFIAFSLVLIDGNTMTELFENETKSNYETYTAYNTYDLMYLRYCYQAKNFTDDQVGLMSEIEADEEAELFEVTKDNSKKAAVGSTLLTTLLSGNPFFGVTSGLTNALGTAALTEGTGEIYNRSRKSIREALASENSISSNLSSQLSDHQASRRKSAQHIMDSYAKGIQLSSDDIRDIYASNGVVKDKDTSCVIVNGMDINEIDFSEISVSESNPVTVYVYGQIGFFDIVLTVFKYLFPCLLCAASVKMAGQISGMIVGR